jgi:hypothetical protein
LRILIRTSKTAIWARRLGSLAVPLVVLSVLMHRFALMSTGVFQIIAAIAASVAALAVVLAVVAVIRLWVTGDHGWRQAFWGALWGGLCLAPFFWHAHLAMRYLPVTDVSTASRSFLPLMFEPDTAVMPAARILPRSEQMAAFPTALTRAYPIVAEELHALVLRLVEQKGWELRYDRSPGQYPGRVNARITSIIGWREEAVFGLVGTETGSKIDMRSASIGAMHDFGSNGRRIESFLKELDAEVSAFIRDAPGAVPPDGAGDTEGPGAETGGN